MLEEALRREGTSGKDLGWKRWSEKEGLKRTQTPDLKRNQSQAGIQGSPAAATAEDEPSGRRRSASIGSSAGGTASAVGSPTIATPPAPAESSRFFKFRFGGGSTRDSVAKINPAPTPPNRSPVIPNSAANPPAHLTSASLPTLANGPSGAPAAPPSRPPSPNTIRAELNNLAMELELMKAQHNALQRAHNDLQSTHTSLSGSHRTLSEEKKALEEELESLSQALFEEANKMVADERKRAAVFEEELDTCRSEKEALKGALKVVEEENGRFRQKAEAVASNDTSSLNAVKSQPSSVKSQPSPANSQPSSPMVRSPPRSPVSPVGSISRPAEDLEDLDLQLPRAEDLEPIVNLTSRPGSRSGARPSSRTGSLTSSSRPGTPSKAKRADFRPIYI